jgi:tetratricopeptide (TPR) repeat protein
MGQAFLMQIVLLVSLLLPVSPPKKPVDNTVLLRRVYARLLQTIGNPADAPVLKLLPRRETGIEGHALYQAGKPASIELGDDVLTLCAGFGPDADAALACLLGHELAHFQYRHRSKQGFFSPTVVPNGNPGSVENLEALADRSGVFMAYLAGYEAFTVAPRVYERFYDAFVHAPIPYYPTKLQRIKMVCDTTARVQELAQLFEVGEISYLMHDYVGASRAFEALITRYPSVVTRNNLGAIKLNLALAQMEQATDKPRLRFAFPIEFDSDNRLLNKKRRDVLTYMELLTEAQYLFKIALDEQPTHQAARLNLAIAEYLLEHSEQARQTLVNSSSTRSANMHLMLGIVQADLGQNDEARKSFKLAVANGAFRAKENEAYFLKGLEPGWKQWFGQLVKSRKNRQCYRRGPTRWFRPDSRR